MTLRMAKATSVRPSGWLTTAGAAQYLGFADNCKHPIRAFWKFAKRQGIPSVRRGRVLLYAPSDLDRALLLRQKVDHRGA